jgi:hypothetical protein
MQEGTLKASGPKKFEKKLQIRTKMAFFSLILVKQKEAQPGSPRGLLLHLAEDSGPPTLLRHYLFEPYQTV